MAKFEIKVERTETKWYAIEADSLEQAREITDALEASQRFWNRYEDDCTECYDPDTTVTLSEKASAYAEELTDAEIEKYIG